MAVVTRSGTKADGASGESASGLAGLITEQHLELADEEFPGIAMFFETCRRDGVCPKSFLELLALFGAF